MGAAIHRRWLALPLMLAGLGVAGGVWGRALVVHERETRTRFADDVCQHVAPFVVDPAPADGPLGFIDAYWRACLPAGYRLLYGAAARWGSPRALSHALPYGLLAVLVLALAAGAARFGGAPAAWGVALAALGSEVFFTRMVGGLPRAFAFPIVAALAACAIRGKTFGYIACVVLAFAFYPAVGVAGLLALGGLWLLPARDRGDAAEWSLRRRVLALGATGGVCVLLALPNFLALQRFGPGIAPQDYGAYPEAGPGGRLRNVDRADFDMSLGACVVHYAPDAFRSGHAPWRPKGIRWIQKLQRGFWWVAIGLVAVALPHLLRRCAAARRLAVLTAAVAMAYGLARAGTPLLFMPERHVAFAVPVLTLMWLVAAAATMPRLWRKSPEPSARAGNACALGVGLAGLLLLGGVPVPGQGTVRLGGAALYDFLGQQPRGTFIAGWPNWMSPVPYVSGKPVLLSYETHLPYHQGYAGEMRRRMEDLIAAYFATSAEPLQRLRQAYGVTHLVVDAGHLQARPPRYFGWFDHQAQQAFSTGAAEGFEALRRREAAVYDDGARFVLDLRTLPD